MPRIIAGELGGRPIPGPPGKGTRPTSDRTREALFSRLTTWDALTGARVLDLYAGTGALSFEALSRGAASALLVEMHAATARQLRGTAEQLGLAARCEVRAGRAEQVVTQLRERLAGGGAVAGADAGCGAGAGVRAGGGAVAGAVGVPDGGFTLVFLDPPYAVTTEDLEELLQAIGPVLAPDALVVIERSRRSRPIAWPEGWADDGTKSYGDTVLQYGGPAAD